MFHISMLTRLMLMLVAASAAQAAEPTPYAAASLPAEMLSRPAAATCPALRSGNYRMLTPTLGGTLADQTSTMLLDAARLSFTRVDGSRGIWEAKGNCHFTDPGADGFSVDYVVSQAGVLVGRITVNGGSSYRSVFAFPEQEHALAELAGTWNVLGLREGGDGLYPDGGSVSYDRAGVAIAATECANPATWAIDVCSDGAKSETPGSKPFAADPSGGFTRQTGRGTTRLFLYRSGIGQPMMVGIGSEGAFFFGTVAEPMKMPATGFSSRAWNLDITAKLAAATSIYAISNMTVAVDTRRQSWVRRKQNIGLPDEHLETLLANHPRDGFFSRPAGDAPTTGAATSRMLHFNELNALYLPGMGLAALVLPAIKLFELSIVQP